MEKNNKIFIGISVAVIVIIGILYFVFLNNDTDITVADNTQTNTTTKSVESVQDINETSGVGAVSISYANALIKYADRRIQLDENCQAYPNTVTYKDNTGIMIDNRSNNTQTIKIGATFTIKPYGFKIVVLPDIYLKSKTLLVDCNQSQNVATILVQE